MGDRRRDPGLKRLLLIFAVALLMAPPSSWASSHQESLFQDDAALIFSTYQGRERTLDEMKTLGVDVVRSNVLWNWVASRPNSTRKPRKVKYDWFRWDRLVEGAEARGIDVQLTLTGPIPAWASRCKKLRHTCRPDPREYGRFVAAAAKHFRSVKRWSIWNEPNQAGWLYPQTEAPQIYRSLAYAAIDALHSNGHAHDEILLGETAPLGRRFGPPDKLNMAPLRFWRKLLCLHCKPLRVTGIAHHPYTRGGAGSPLSVVGPDDVTLASIGRLERLIDRRFRKRLPIYLTEYGFQTNPPDRYSGVSPSLAAVWLNQSDWMAFRNPRIASVAQYELRDERSLGAFQTGLRFRDGRAKPGLSAYRVPLWVTPGAIWGQARAGGIGSRVEVLMQSRPGRPFKRFKTVVIGNPQGYFTLHTNRHAYRWRLAWLHGKHRVLSRASVPAAR